jgi:mRNA-degrading endonuclease RelE of RelBE toxin-antitoxin system
MAYRIEFGPGARDGIKALSGPDRATILGAVREQLRHEPCRPTRNRKPLRANPLAPWVLRVGHLRVYYEASELAGPCVTIRAVGTKVRERVLIGGVEIDLS